MNTNDLSRGLAAALLLGACAFAAEAEPTLRQTPELDEKVTRFLDRHRGQWHDYNVPEIDGRTLHDLIVKNGFTRALEIGTSTGHSTIWIARALAKTGGVDMFATVVAFDVDLATGRCRYSCAGHPPPALVRGDGTVVLLDDAGSLPLGVADSPRYVDGEVRLEADETLFLYTDGLVERPAQPFDVGLARLVAALAEHAKAEPPELVDAVLDELVSFGDRPDDIAVLALRPAPARGERFSRQYPLEAPMLALLRADLRGWLVEIGSMHEVADEIVLSTSEAVANAIEHAETPAQQTVEVEASLRGRDEVVIVVQDFGSWRKPTGETDRGRGLVLIRALMDSVDIETAPRGTRVTMHRRLTPATSAR